MKGSNFKNFKNKWYVSPPNTWNSEKDYLPSKILVIPLVTTLLSQNGYDFFSALEAIYLSDEVYDEISDWKGEGCLLFAEEYYDNLCNELEIQPQGYDFRKIANLKIKEQKSFVSDIEYSRYNAGLSGWDFFIQHREEIKNKIEEENLG